MKRNFIKDIAVGKKNVLRGYVESLRNKKSMAFIVLKDVSGKIQVTVEKEKYPEVAAVVDKLTLDSFIMAEGTVVANDFVKMGGVEMLAESITLYSTADVLPFTRLDRENGVVVSRGNINEAEYDLRMDYRWIDLRSEANQLIFKVQTEMVRSMREWLTKRDFIELHSPKLIGAASESGADVFKVDYFDKTAYLCQSPQFYKQMAMAAGLDRIFEVGPVFRAEKSRTSKHTTEFTGFDLEFSYIESFYDVMKLEEELVTAMLKDMAEKFGADIKRVFGLEVIVPTEPFPIMKLADVYAELKARYNFTVPAQEMDDLTTEAERMCKNLAWDMYKSEFLFVTDYRPEKRAFYHMRKDGMPQGYDLIWRGCEITTGAQREHRFEQLKAQAKEKGLGKDIEFYLNFFKYGCPPHGGFGIGVDRMTMLLLGLSIKEAMYIFRSPDRLTP